MKQAGGKIPSAAGLTDLLSSQKASIMNALPSGLHLGSIPGLGTGKAAVNAATGAAADATNNLAKWFLPLVAILAIAFLAWWFLIRDKGTSAPTSAPTTPPSLPTTADIKVPDVGELSKDLTGDLTSLSDVLTGVKDAATADAALPKLNDINAKLDTVKAGWEHVPSAAKTSLTDLVKSKLGSLKDLITKVLGMTGVGEKLKPVLDSILAKLTTLAG
jgi:hypothetical protein